MVDSAEADQLILILGRNETRHYVSLTPTD